MNMQVAKWMSSTVVYEILFSNKHQVIKEKCVFFAILLTSHAPIIWHTMFSSEVRATLCCWLFLFLVAYLNVHSCIFLIVFEYIFGFLDAIGDSRIQSNHRWVRLLNIILHNLWLCLWLRVCVSVEEVKELKICCRWQQVKLCE